MRSLFSISLRHFYCLSIIEHISEVSSFTVSYFWSRRYSFALCDYNEKRPFHEIFSITCRKVNKEFGVRRSFFQKEAASPEVGVMLRAFQHERIAGIPSKWTIVGLPCKYSTHAPLHTHTHTRTDGRMDERTRAYTPHTGHLTYLSHLWASNGIRVGTFGY